MNKIAVITDSTSVINKEVLENTDNLYSIPLHIIIDNDSYRDGIDISSKEFFDKLNEVSILPTTSQPAVGDVIDLFEKLITEYDHLIYITLSSGISGTFQTGMLARGEVSENITVFDSLATSVVQEQMVLETIEMINNNNKLEDIINRLNDIRLNSNIYLVVDDLKHLNRTGRISLTAANVGNILKLKPVLKFDDSGKIVVLKKIRTIKKAHNHIVELIKEAELTKDSKIMIAHANGLEAALKLKEELLKLKNYPNHEIVISELSPVISLHTGPNTVGLAYIK